MGMSHRHVHGLLFEVASCPLHHRRGATALLRTRAQVCYVTQCFLKYITLCGLLRSGIQGYMAQTMRSSFVTSTRIDALYLLQILERLLQNILISYYLYFKQNQSLCRFLGSRPTPEQRHLGLMIKCLA